MGANIKCVFCRMSIDDDCIYDDVAVCLECGGIFNINNIKENDYEKGKQNREGLPG